MSYQQQYNQQHQQHHHHNQRQQHHTSYHQHQHQHQHHIPPSTSTNPLNYPQTYPNISVKTEPQAESSSSAYYPYDQLRNIDNTRYYNQDIGMSAAAVLPPTSAMNTHQSMQKGMMGYPTQSLQHSFSTTSTPAQPPKQSLTPGYPENNVPRTSRFQQLINKKFAAEQNFQNAASSSSQTPQATQDVNMGSPYLKLAQAQMMQQSSDTVFNKDFVNRHYSPQGNEHISIPQTMIKQGVHQPNQAQPSPQQMQSFLRDQQQQQQQIPFTTSQPQTQPVSQPQPQRLPFSQPQFQISTSPLGNAPAVNPYPIPSSSTASSSRDQPVQNASTQWNDPFNHARSTSAPQIPFAADVDYTSTQFPPAPSRSVSADQAVLNNNEWMQNAGMNGWIPSVAPTRNPIPRSNPQQHFPQAQAQSQPQPQSATSFSWHVSEARSTSGESSYFAQKSFEKTPVLSPSAHYPSTHTIPSSLPVTPNYPTQYNQSQINVTPPLVSVKIEPDTQHLTVPYTSHNSNMTTSAGASNLYSTSPLLDYGARMFTNMNGSFSLPGSAMYMASMNGGGDSSTLAEGMSGNDGGNGGEGWSDGNGNENGEGSGSGQEGSGSGSGGHDGNGHGGHGDDGRDGEENGDEPGSTRKGKKLTLACHFCRRRKLKCNGVQPKCDNCTKRNEVCSWDDNVRRRGPGKATKERREKAAREAAAVGLTNSNSLLHPLPDIEPDISDIQHQHKYEDSNNNNNIDNNHDGLMELTNNLPIVDALSSLPGLENEGDMNEFRLNLNQHNQSLISTNSNEAQMQEHERSPTMLNHLDNIPISITEINNNNNNEHENLIELSELSSNNNNNNVEIPIDPALAALSSVIPGTLAELEQPNNTTIKGEKRKSDILISNENGLNGIDANTKRVKLDSNNFTS